MTRAVLDVFEIGNGAETVCYLLLREKSGGAALRVFEIGNGAV